MKTFKDVCEVDDMGQAYIATICALYHDRLPFDADASGVSIDGDPVTVGELLHWDDELDQFSLEYLLEFSPIMPGEHVEWADAIVNRYAPEVNSDPVLQGRTYAAVGLRLSKALDRVGSNVVALHK